MLESTPLRARLMLAVLSTACLSKPPPATPPVAAPAVRTGPAVEVARVEASAHPPTAARDRAIAEALLAANVTATAIIDATRDVDGDGEGDALFHTESPVAMGIARSRSPGWTAEVLPRQTATWESVAWSETVPLGRGAAVMLVRGMRPAADQAPGNQPLEVLVLEPGAPARSVFVEVFPRAGRWSLRAMGDNRLEIRGEIPSSMNGADAGTAMAVRKVIRPGEGDGWQAAGCWDAEPREPVPTIRACEVSAPEGTRERQWERFNFGPPMMEATPVTLLYPGGEGPAALRGAQNWCVSARQRTFWVYLPAPVTAPCVADPPRR